MCLREGEKLWGCEKSCWGEEKLWGWPVDEREAVGLRDTLWGEERSCGDERETVGVREKLWEWMREKLWG